MHCKGIIICGILLFIIKNTFSQKSSTASSFKSLDFSEAPDPKPFNNTAWKDVSDNVMISFASADIRYEKTIPPPVPVIQTQWEVTAWKGEKVHTYIHR